MEFVIVSGMSGAGKSKSASFLEDMGFYCVDNMPVQLIPQFAELCMAVKGRYERVALVTDIRGGDSFDELFSALERLEDIDYSILFMEASTDAIIKRYKETRRKHPLSGGRTLSETVAHERELLTPIRERADYVIDTTALSSAKLRSELFRIFGGGVVERAMVVTVTSFGFKYGIPIEADLVFDVRFMPNPYYKSELSELTGLDEQVRDFIFGYRETTEFMEKLQDMMAFLLPRYVEEGKSSLVISIGCTGGKHRSVAVARELAEFTRGLGYRTIALHRDIGRG